MVDAIGVPPLIAHRGGRLYGPDCSRQALGHAIAGGVDGVEVDVVRTRDDRLVLLHDAYLPLATTLDGWAAERSLEEIQGARLLDSSGRPTDQRPLSDEEFVDLVAGRPSIVQFEVKAFADPDEATSTAGLLLRFLDSQPGLRRDRVEVISFWPEVCVLAAAAGWKTRLIIACAYLPDALAEWAAQHRISGVILEAPYFSPAVVGVWRSAGLSIMCGATNDVALARVVMAFAPDAISTDRPFELAEALSE
jgi:glycerophosphoryl diester phosphodiesterase